MYAPTNEAFRSLPADALAKLMGEPAELKRVLLGHVTKGTYFLNVLNSRSSGTDMVLPTLDGGTNKIMVDGNSKQKKRTLKVNLLIINCDRLPGIKVDGAPVVTSTDNIMAENGVIHALSRVLMP